MAPRSGVARPRDIDFSAVGTVGRRTGITLAPRPIDENGMEDASHLFSSPRKPSPLKNSVNAFDAPEDEGASQSSAEMTGINSSGLTPAHALSTRKSLRGPSLPPRSVSPKKTGISGTARRSNAINLLGKDKDIETFDPEDRENTPHLTPTRGNQNARRFSPSPDKSPLRDITIRNITSETQSRLLDVQEFRNEITPSVEVVDDEEGQSSEHEAEESTDGPVQSIDYAPILGDDEDEEIPESVPESRASSVGLRPVYDDEDADQTFEPEQGVRSSLQKRAEANSTRKRKSDTFDRDAEIPLSSPVAKKARRQDEKQRKGKEPSVKPASQGASSARSRPCAKSSNTKTQMSARQQEELNEIVEKVKARPGRPRSLYLLRRETPADDSVTHTRSGRLSVKPLAYWRNERCVFGGSPASSSLQDGARFPLNSISAIIRTEEMDQNSQSKRGRKKGRKVKGKGKGTARAQTEDLESSDSSLEDDAELSDPDAEPWESEVGTFRGPVSVWDPQEQAPIDEEEEIEIAYAPGAIQTREVKRPAVLGDGPTFRYAKLLSTRFFGTGIVELPPGGIKTPKNSRKMHMSFFVVKGRVTVTVGPLGGEETGSVNRFSVGKGGFWQVPRGNQYAIENELTKPARIFFSQACEPAPLEED